MNSEHDLSLARKLKKVVIWRTLEARDARCELDGLP